MPAPNQQYSDRHLEVAEELKELLQDQLPPAVKVARVYAPEEDHKRPAGRFVWVIPTTEQDVQRLARRRMLSEYGCSIIVTEHYVEPAEASNEGPVPQAWVDDQCGWVKENIYTFLNDRVRASDRLLEALWPETCRIAVKCDPDQLLGKTFVSVVEVTYREGREG